MSRKKISDAPMKRRELILPAHLWDQLDTEARDLSTAAGKTITAQDLIRKRLSTKCNEKLLAFLRESQLVYELGKVLNSFGLKICNKNSVTVDIGDFTI
jgi:hypothetical protein